MQRVKIKVCGMRDPSNIKEVAELRPDYMGFIFYTKSKRYVSDDCSEFVNGMPIEIMRAGVFVNETIPEIVKKVNLFNLDILQIHGNEPPGYCEELKSLGFTLIKAFGIDHSFDFTILDGYKKACDYFLFDTKSTDYGGSGKKFNWSLLSGYDNSKPFFLSGGIGPGDAESFENISELNIHALDLNSKFETEPAFKDIILLKEFMSRIQR